MDRDSWETPKELFDTLNSQYNFKVDCCATKDNKKTLQYCSSFLEISMRIISRSWMNPPFSKAYEMFEHFFKVIKEGVAIYRCDNMETKVWQDIILKHAAWIFIPKGRISYEGMKGKESRFPSALIGFNVEPPINLVGRLLK